MLFHGLLFAVSPAIASVVDLGYAKYEGEQIGAGHLEAFGPIRYAAKPERWALPTEPLPEGGEVKKRSAFTPSCHGVGARHLSNKAPSTWTPGGGDEDCLFLKLWKPVGDVQDLPVIVHIHGGGYQEGDVGGYPKLAAQAASKSEGKGVIFLSIGYRLGVFGFLGVPDLANGNGVMNAGFHDQRFALQWVQKHISKFGGDPKQVTIVGESAGGGSVMFHTIADAPDNSNLFKYAIMTSPYAPNMLRYDDPRNLQLYDKLLQKTGCAGNGDSAATLGANTTSVEPASKNVRPTCGKGSCKTKRTHAKRAAGPGRLQCLRAINDQTLHKAHWELNQETFVNILTFAPVVDDLYLPQNLVALAARGKTNARATLAGTNLGESVGFFEQSIANADDYLKQYFKLDTSNKEFMAALDTAYGEAGSAYDKVMHAINDRQFVCGPNFVTIAASGSGEGYRYTYNGAGHIMDTGHWLFGNEGDAPESYSAFDKAMIDMYLSFAATGKPALAGSKVEFPSYGKGNELRLIYEVGDGVSVQQHKVTPLMDTLGGQDTCAFWKKYYREANF